MTKMIKATTETIKEAIIKLNDDFQEGSDMAFHALLNELENRISEKEFCKFCDNL